MSAADNLLIEPSYAEDCQSDTGFSESNADLADWLNWLAELLPAVRCVALVRVNSSGVPVSVSRNPGSPALPEVAMALASRACRKRSKQSLQTQSPDELLLAVPVLPKDRKAVASSALLLISDPLSRQQQGAMAGLADWALRSLDWAEKPNTRIESGQCHFRAREEPGGIQQLLDQLSLRYDGAQCAFTWMKRGRRGLYNARVVAMSGQYKVDSSRAVVRKLAMLMEGVVTDVSQVPAPFYESRSTLSGSDSEGLIDNASLPVRFVVPVTVRGELFLVSLFLAADQDISVATRGQLAQELIPAFQSAWMMRELDAPLREIAWRRLRVLVDWSGHHKIKRLLQTALIACAFVLLFYPVDKRVSAEVNVEAAERHALIAPMDGFVKSIKARAGDRVAQGDLLATLDGDDLLRQADKWEAEAQKNRQDYLSALAVHDRVELSTLRESRLLIQTELEQVRAQLARHELRAPIAGIVLNDSVEDALGSAVKAGQILFEVGSAAQYRLALQVPERRIADIAVGQSVTLRMTADPKQRRQARVNMLIPIATASQGQNTFKVYALPEGQEGVLRPGMKGIGKILVGRASRLSQWTGSLWSRWVWLAWKLGLSR